jgi:hypothetical protein
MPQWIEAEWNVPAITPLSAICTWKSGAAPFAILPDEAATRILCYSKTLRRVSTLM